jgi:hypothetical protein
VTATKRATTRAARAMAMATKKAMVMAARLIATATERAIVRKGNAKGGKRFGDGNSGGGRQKGQWRERLRAMAMVKRVAGIQQRQRWGRRKGHGRSRYNWREGDDGGNGPWFVCVFWCVWRDHKK